MGPLGGVDWSKPRMKIGVLIPSTNTSTEPEHHRILPPGVTAHGGRMLVTQPDVGTDKLYLYLNDQMMAALDATVENLVTAKLDRLSLCMSAMAFVGGKAGDAAVRERVAKLTDVPLSTGPEAFMAALACYGARRVAMISPFQPAMEAETVRHFEEYGIEVVTTTSFLAQRTTAIAEIGPDQVRRAVAECDADGVDAIVQPGTNIHMAELAAAAELWLGKPVLHANTVMAWHALRAHGIDDRIPGFGSLLWEH